MVVVDEPMVARRFDIEPRRSPWRLATLGIILIASVAAGIKMDLLEKIEALIPLVALGTPTVLPQQQTTAPEEGEIATVQAPDQMAVDEPDAESIVDGPPVEDIFDEGLSEEIFAESAASETPVT